MSRLVAGTSPEWSARPAATVVALVILCVASGAVTNIAAERRAPGAPRAAEATRTIYFSARGADGTPVRDLTIADLSLTAMGESWPIVRLEKATAPLDVAVILDATERERTTEPLVEFLRQTLTDGTVSIRTLGRGPSKMVDDTSDPEALESAVLELGRRAVPGRTYLADAVNESANELRKRRSARPVILVVTTVGERVQVDYPGQRFGPTGDYAAGEYAAMADAAQRARRLSRRRSHRPAD